MLQIKAYCNINQNSIKKNFTDKWKKLSITVKENLDFENSEKT